MRCQIEPAAGSPADTEANSSRVLIWKNFTSSQLPPPLPSASQLHTLRCVQTGRTYLLCCAANHHLVTPRPCTKLGRFVSKTYRVSLTRSASVASAAATATAAAGDDNDNNDDNDDGDRACRSVSTKCTRSSPSAPPTSEGSVGTPSRSERYCTYFFPGRGKRMEHTWRFAVGFCFPRWVDLRAREWHSRFFKLSDHPRPLEAALFSRQRLRTLSQRELVDHSRVSLAFLKRLLMTRPVLCTPWDRIAFRKRLPTISTPSC